MAFARVFCSNLVTYCKRDHFRSHKKQKINTKVIYNDLLVKKNNEKEAHELKKEKGMTKANQSVEVVVLEDESYREKERPNSDLEVV